MTARKPLLTPLSPVEGPGGDVGSRAAKGDDDLVDGGALLLEWAHGWSVSRGARLPVKTYGGVRIERIPPAAGSRYVLPVVDSTVVSGLGDVLTAPGTEIKTLTAAAALRACLGAGWSMHDTCVLMTSGFIPGAPAVPDGCTARVVQTGDAAVAEVRDGDGAMVSSARLARWGRNGIVDQVETLAGYRRRGLATATMAMLGNWALGHGLRTGLLSATDQGAALYRRLGWVAVGEIAGAVRSR